MGLYVQDISDPLLADIARGAEDRLRDHGYSLELTTDPGGEAAGDAPYIKLLEQRVAALMLMLGSDGATETQRVLGGIDVPLVLLDSDPASVEANAVLTDSRAGVRDAVLDLLRQGPDGRLALIAGSLQTRASRERLAGFLSAHEEYGVAPHDQLIQMESNTEKDGYESMCRLLELPEPPNGVVVGGVRLASGGLTAMNERSVRAGRDIALVSCDEVDLMQLFDPPISVVRRDARRMGALAATLSLDALCGAPPRVEFLPTEYVRRGTSAMCAPLRPKPKDVSTHVG